MMHPNLSRLISIKVRVHHELRVQMVDCILETALTITTAIWFKYFLVVRGRRGKGRHAQRALHRAVTQTDLIGGHCSSFLVIEPLGISVGLFLWR